MGGQSVLRERNVSGIAFAALITFGQADVASGAEWTITPAASLTVTGTDNVDGEPRGEEESDLITRVTPSIDVRGVGARLQTNYSYSLTREDFIAGGRSEFSQNLLGFSTHELMEDLFFIENQASISLQTINDDGALTAGAQARDDNQSEVVNTSISPVARYRFGSWVDVETRYRFSQVLFDVLLEDPEEGTPSDTFTHAFLQRFQSGREFNRLRWTLTGSADITSRTDLDEADGDDGGGGDFQSISVDASAEYVINRKISILGSFGADFIDDPSIDDQTDVDGVFWTIGGRWRPGPRTDISLEFGRRFDDQFWNGSASYQLGGFTTIRLFFDQTVGTTQTALNQNLGFIGQDLLGNLIDLRTGLPIDPTDPAFDLTDQDAVFRARTLNASLAGSRGRANFGATAFYSEREEEPSGLTDRSLGGSANFGWALTRLTNLNLSSSVRTTNDDASVDQTTVNLSLSLSYNLSETLSGTTSYRHLRRMSEDEVNELRENAIVFSLRKAF